MLDAWARQHRGTVGRRCAATKQTSFAILDRFADAGFNAVDTADAYSAWASGNRGGESESIRGRLSPMTHPACGRPATPAPHGKAPATIDGRPWTSTD